MTGVPDRSTLGIVPAGGGHSTNLSMPGENLFQASYTPSGRRLVFVLSASGSPALGQSPTGQIATSNLTGGDVHVLTGPGNSQPAISPNGRLLLFVHAGAIWLARADGRHPHRSATLRATTSG